MAEKPLVFIVADEEYETSAYAAFWTAGNEVVASRDFKGPQREFQLEDFLKTAHRDKTRKIALIASEDAPWFNAIMQYVHTAISHRAMGFLLIESPLPEWENRLDKKSWRQKAYNLGAYGVFDKTFDSLDDIVQEVNGTPVWGILDEIRQDELTGLDNFKGFSSSVLIDLEMMRKTRHPWCSVLLLIDIDDFKTINDTHGHLYGDEVIKIVGHMLRAQVRRGAHPCRYHGDEFLVYLSGLDIGKTKNVVRRLRRAMRKLVFQGKSGGPREVTLSIGIVAITCYEVEEVPAVTLGKAIEKADTKMYEDKKARKKGR